MLLQIQKSLRTSSSKLKAPLWKNSRLRPFHNGAFKGSQRLSLSKIGSPMGARLASIALITGVGVYLSRERFEEVIHSDSQKYLGNGVTVEELQKHNSIENGVWVAINGQVYDLTDFLASHPGGTSIILKYAGKNASKIFNRYHAKGIIENFLSEENHIGPLRGDLEAADDITEAEGDLERLEYLENKPALSRIFNISDFEAVAKKILTPNAWAYYSSGSDDEITLRENHYAYQRIFFNPKVLEDVTDIDISTEMLGVKTAAPFYCSATAQARLGHEDGELSIARGCGSEGIIQMISNSASYSFDEITDAAFPGQPQWFQLYVRADRSGSYKSIEACEKKNIKGIFVTVDTAQFGRREKDLKHKVFDDDDGDDDGETKFKREDITLTYKDPGLTWKDIINFKKSTEIPIVLKGVQRVEDVLLAIEHNVDAVVLSNHGGRQLDFTRAPVELLADVMPILKEKKLDKKIEIYVDGGVRRGSDILKALCLGAKGVGLGRPFLYANSVHGEKGVKKAIRLLKQEMVTDMKLLGVSRIDELTPELLDTRNLYSRPYYSDSMYNSGYEPIVRPKFKNE